MEKFASRDWSEIALGAGILGGIALWAWKKPEAQNPAAPDSAALYAFVQSLGGAWIYQNTKSTPDPVNGYGKDPITLIGEATYLGKLTGISYQNLLQVVTNIEGQIYRYWVDKSRVRLAPADQVEADGLRYKLQSEIREIIHKTIDKILP